MKWVRDLILQKMAEHNSTEETAATHRPGIHLRRGEPSGIHRVENGVAVSEEASGFRARNKQLNPDGPGSAVDPVPVGDQQLQKKAEWTPDQEADDLIMRDIDEINFQMRGMAQGSAEWKAAEKQIAGLQSSRMQKKASRKSTRVETMQKVADILRRKLDKPEPLVTWYRDEKTNDMVPGLYSQADKVPRSLVYPFTSPASDWEEASDILKNYSDPDGTFAAIRKEQSKNGMGREAIDTLLTHEILRRKWPDRYSMMSDELTQETLKDSDLADSYDRMQEQGGYYREKGFDKKANRLKGPLSAGKAVLGYLKDPAGRKLTQSATQTAKELGNRQKSTRNLADLRKNDRAARHVARKAGDVTAPPTFSGPAANKAIKARKDWERESDPWANKAFEAVKEMPHASDILRLVSDQRRRLVSSKKQLDHMTNVGKQYGGRYAFPANIIQAAEKGVSRGSKRLGRLEGKLKGFSTDARATRAQTQRTDVAAEAARKAEWAAAARYRTAASGLAKRQKLNKNVKRGAVGAGAAAGAAD